MLVRRDFVRLHLRSSRIAGLLQKQQRGILNSLIANLCDLCIGKIDHNIRHLKEIMLFFLFPTLFCSILQFITLWIPKTNNSDYIYHHLLIALETLSKSQLRFFSFFCFSSLSFFFFSKLLSIELNPYEANAWSPLSFSNRSSTKSSSLKIAGSFFSTKKRLSFSQSQQAYLIVSWISFSLLSSSAWRTVTTIFFFCWVSRHFKHQYLLDGNRGHSRDLDDDRLEIFENLRVWCAFQLEVIRAVRANRKCVCFHDCSCLASFLNRIDGMLLHKRDIFCREEVFNII